MHFYRQFFLKFESYSLTDTSVAIKDFNCSKHFLKSVPSSVVIVVWAKKPLNLQAEIHPFECLEKQLLRTLNFLLSLCERPRMPSHVMEDAVQYTGSGDKTWHHLIPGEQAHYILL